jgi:glycosyltransferase involved in cell wall biosynthesis
MDRDWQEAGPAAPDGRSPSAAPELSVVLPCFNEAANIAALYRKVAAASAGLDREIIFVDDGSADSTAEEVEKLRLGDASVRLLRFVRNAGHQNALRAGYRAARGALVLTMDSDLQHPADLIPAMVAKAREGFDVVQMVRQGSQKGFFKDLFSRAFYKLFNSLSDVPIVEQASDFRLVSRYVCDVLNALPERNLVVRAILPYLGFKTGCIEFAVGERAAGQAAYSLKKSWDLGAQALFNFSALPLKLAMRVGLLISALAFAYGLYNVGAKIFTDRNVPGYTDLIASTLFLGGLILVYLGILGRYILVILDHLKKRPEYLVSEAATRSYLETNAPAEPPRTRSERPQGRRAG